jgi:hypothetical protein
MDKIKKLLDGADPREVLESGLVDGVPEILARPSDHPNYVWEYEGEEYQTEYQEVVDAVAEEADEVGAGVTLQFEGEATVELDLGFFGFQSRFGEVTIGSGRDSADFEVELSGHVSLEVENQTLVDKDLNHNQLDVDSFTELFTFASQLGNAVENEAMGMIGGREKDVMKANLELYGLR